MAAAMNEGKAALAENNGDVTEPISKEEQDEVLAEAMADAEDEINFKDGEEA